MARYWVGGSGNWDASSTTHWSSSSGGGSGAAVPTSADDVIVDSGSGFGAGGTISLTGSAGSAVCNNFTSSAGHAYTIAHSTDDIKVFGNLTLESFIVSSGVLAFVMSAISVGHTVTIAGADCGILTFNGVGGAWALQDNITSIVQGITLLAGALDANNKTVSMNKPVVSSGTATRSLKLGAGLWTINASSPWQMSGTGLTIDATGSTLKFTYSGIAAMSFYGNGKAYNNVWMSRGTKTSSIDIHDANTFADFKDDGTAAHQIRFEEGLTQTFSTFTVSGASGKLIGISSVTAAGAASTATHTLSCASGIISRDYLDIQHSAAAGGASWYAGANSTDHQAVSTAGSGWVFTAPNTPPTITSGPTTTYDTGTDTRSGKPWGFNATPHDPEQTGANALTWKVTTSSTYGAGTQVATGTCTSDSALAVTGLAYDAAGLVAGSQTLYLHLYDGTDHTVTAGSFTLLVLTPVVQTVASAWKVRQAIAQTKASTWNVRTIVSPATFASSWKVRQAITQTAGSSWNVRAIVTATKASSWNVRATVTSTFDSSWKVRTSAVQTAASTWNVRQPINQTKASTWKVRQSVAKTAASTWNVRQSITATFASIWNVWIESPRGLRIDVYSAAGVKLGFGPITSALACSYSLVLDQVGNFTLDIPAEEERASYVTIGTQLWFYVGREGLVFRGITEKKQSLITTDGKTVLRVTGSSLARQLVNANTQLGLAFNGSTLATAVGASATPATLLYGSGWAAGALDTPATTLLARFDGLSEWEGLAKTAQQFKLHVREDAITLSGGTPVRKVDVGAFGAASGLVFKNVDAISPNLQKNMLLYPIANLTVAEDASDLWNSIIPVGAGAGVNQLTLKFSDRSVAGGFAYNISTTTGPDGQPLYYLEDAASVAAYGRRQRVVSIKDAAPLALSAAGMTAASNALYDQAVTYLTRYKDPPASYDVEVVGLKHVSGGAPIIKTGDKVRLIYHGIANDQVGTRAWLTVDSNVYLMGFTRSFQDTGADTWKLTVSTVDRLLEDDGTKTAQAFQNIFALSVAMKPYTYREVAGPERGSLDSASSKTMVLTVNFDANVGMLHQAKLQFIQRALRSNVSVAASGGSSAPTTSSGGSQAPTSSSGGSQTPTSDASSSSTTTSSGSHTHSFGFATGTDGAQSTGGGTGHNHASATTDSADGLVGAHAHTVSGGSGTESTHTHAVIGHQHVVAGQTTASATDHNHGMTHTHTVTIAAHTHTVTISAHDHTVTISAHTHSLTYGVVDDTTPSVPQLSIAINGTDRTAAITTQLGDAGAWRDTMNSWVTIDISPWLSDANGIVLQQNNAITFTVNKAITHLDIEAMVRSLVTATSLTPV